MTTIKTIKQLEKEIEDLNILLDMERQVKQEEVRINMDLKERIEKLEITIETLQKLNEDFLNKIAYYKNFIKRNL
jgi:chaperonin cofactor prefoldin